ncbi:MAG: pyruvate,water dikinase [Crocinitomicaceae bacterium]|jgi:pyruvate,water dikinase
MSICFLVLFLISCTGNTQNHVPQLRTQEQFIEWSSAPLYQKYGQVSSVKVVYDNKHDKLHFISAKEFDFHYEYCMDKLGFPGDLSDFNDVSYSGEKSRRFLLANINYYKALDKFTFELGPSDRMNIKHLQLFFKTVKEDVFFADRFYLMLNTSHVNSIVKSTTNLPTITPEEIYDGQVYQPISKQKSYGRVRVINDWESEFKDILPTDIIILNTIPEVFPMVSGVVVTEFQTPLSHVTLLGQNRKIPICAYTKAFDTKSLLAFDNKVVEFKVEQDTFYIAESDYDLSLLWKPGERIVLKKNLELDSLVPVNLLRERLSTAVGNKAANFGELHKFSKKLDFVTPESAFAIPFYFYQKHVNTVGAQTAINALLDKDNRRRSQDEVRKDLEAIQNLILNNEVSASLLNDVERMIIRLGDFRRMRFRSSTNAEDMEGFSGAGIYTSKTGEIGNPKKPIDKAIRKVWASLWSYNAFMEREAFNIDHSSVAMGILVHRSFPDEAVNGVAITSNLYRNEYMGFVVNAQLGDESVVQPNGDIQCDQFICYPDEAAAAYGKSEGGIDIINYSSLNNGKLVMTNDEIQELANTLENIKRRYLRNHYIKTSYFHFALDLEFKLDKDTRKLYIKQMRIYNW